MSCLVVSYGLALLLLGDTPSLRVEEQPASLRITLAWPSTVSYTAIPNDRELLLQFDRSVELDPSADLARMAPTWVESVSVGYDTMLVRAARDVTFAVTAQGTTITIELRAAAEGVPAASPPEQEDGERRLQLLRAELQFAERHYAAAGQLLRDVLADAPDSVPALLILAQVEAQRGHWRAGERLLERAGRLEPQNNSGAELRNEIRRSQTGRIRADVEYKDVQGAQRESIARFSSHVFIASGVRLGASAERNETAFDGVRLQQERGELYLQADFMSGTALRLVAFATRAAAGGGLSATHADGGGRTLAQVEYRRPFWDILEGIVGKGTRDRIEMRREQRLGSRLALRVGTAANRYGLDGRDRVAESLAVDGGASVVISRRNPSLGLEYSLDVESRRFLSPDTLPLVSREVHAASLTTQVRLSRSVSADAFAGYAWDRLGGRGPFSGGRVTRDGPGRLGAELWIERRLNALATTQQVVRAGAHLFWRGL